MSQQHLSCCMENRKLRTEYHFDHFDHQPTANKLYWRNFRIFLDVLVPSVCLPPPFLRRNYICFENIKFFEIQQARFFGSDERENVF